MKNKLYQVIDVLKTMGFVLWLFFAVTFNTYMISWWIWEDSNPMNWSHSVSGWIVFPVTVILFLVLFLVTFAMSSYIFGAD